MMESTVDEKEFKIYKELSLSWWKKETLPLLFTMNQIRIPRIVKGLVNTGEVKKEFVGTSKPLQGLLILDIGCGGGFVSEELVRLGATVKGVDVSPDVLKTAKKHAALDPSLTNLEYKCETPEQHVVNNFEKYDVVVASEVIDHLGNQKLFLELCVKCLKPGGSIFVTTKNKTMVSWLTLVVYYEYLTNTHPRGTCLYEKFISPENVQKILQSCNCRTISLDGSFYNMLTGNWWETSSTSWFYAIHAVKDL